VRVPAVADLASAPSGPLGQAQRVNDRGISPFDAAATYHRRMSARPVLA
jgi:hypothetical protein